MNKKVHFKLKCLAYIFIAALATQCNISEPVSAVYEKSFSIAKSNFSDSLISHFPDKVYGAFRMILVAPRNCIENNRCGLVLVVQLSDSTDAYLEKMIDNHSLEHTFYGSECNLIVNPTGGKGGYDKYRDSLMANSPEFSYVLPNFPQILNSSELLIPQEYIDIHDFDIYLLGAAAGRFLNEEYLTGGCGLPNEWRNGYSKGFAIDRASMKALFWLELW